ncbi:MAG: hypothetical protein ABIA77_04740 [Candidatus Omnitrophota bacterium]
MRELFYKNRMGDNPRKHEVSIEEICNKPEIKISKRRSCKYFIKEAYTSSNPEDLKNWITIRKENGYRQNSHILRKGNRKTGENKIACKILGEFFVISGRTAYRVVYVNSIRIQIENVKENNRGVKWMSQ